MLGLPELWVDVDIGLLLIFFVTGIGLLLIFGLLGIIFDGSLCLYLDA